MADTFKALSSICINDAIPFIKTNVKLQIDSNHQKKASPTLYISGPPGIGKSEIYEAFCKENGFGLVVIYLSMTSLSQLTGLPMVVVKDKEGDNRFIPWSYPDIFNFKNMRVEPDIKINKTESGEPIVVMLLDDAHLLEKTQQRVLFQLLSYKAINKHKLPDSVAINLAGNRSEDKAGAQQFLAPVTNRILYVEVHSTLERWMKEFAYKNNVRSDIITFLQFYESLFNTQPLESEPWASPRSWTYASQQLDYFEKDYSLTDDSAYVILKGLVGIQPAGQFLEYKNFLMGWEPDKVLNGSKVITVSTLDKMSCYALLTVCIQYFLKILKDKNFKIDKQATDIVDKLKTVVLEPCLIRAPELVPMAFKNLVFEEVILTKSCKATKFLMDVLDKQYKEILTNAENEAKKGKRGLWGKCAT